MYVGDMEQGRALRPTMHGKAKQKARADWTVVPHTHEAIIDRAQWERVQELLGKRTRQLNFEQNQSPFAGFLCCGDCGRAMVKTRSAGGIYYSCGSYKRYGPTVCSKHSISHKVLEEIVLADLNRIIATVQDWKKLVDERAECPRRNFQAEQSRLEIILERILERKKRAYEDYQDGLLGREDYLRYREDYERQEKTLNAQLEQFAKTGESDPLHHPWVEALLRYEKLTELDRVTVAETIKQIRIFEDGHVEITYTFSNELGLLEAEGGITV